MSYTRILIRERGWESVKESIDEIRDLQNHHSYKIMIPLTSTTTNIWTSEKKLFYLNKNDIILIREVTDKDDN